MKTAHIKRILKGKWEGQFRFILKAKNGEVVATSGTQKYNQKQSAIDTLKSCFPDFKIIDDTVKGKMTIK